MRLNEFFDQILVINLNRRPDRLEKVSREFQRHNLEVSVAEAYDGRLMYPKHPAKVAGQLGCLKSHLECIRYARDHKLQNVLILEDDVEFHDELEERFSQAVEALPPWWDVLYLGGNTNKEPRALTPYAPGLMQVHYLLCLHAYAINAKAYDRILIYAETARNPIIDVIMVELQQELNCFKADPNIAWQSAGYSDIEQHRVDYYFMRGK